MHPHVESAVSVWLQATGSRLRFCSVHLSADGDQFDVVQPDRALAGDVEEHGVGLGPGLRFADHGVLLPVGRDLLAKLPPPRPESEVVRRLRPFSSAPWLALTGVLLGSFLFSMLSDRVGRRPVLIIAALSFAVLTLWTATASSAPSSVYEPE